MKKKTLTPIILVVGLAMVAAVTVYAVANYGTKDDPLVTSSYLQDVVQPRMEDAYRSTLDGQISEMEDQFADQVAAAGGSYVLVTLENGQTLTGRAGTEILMRTGTAAVAQSAAEVYAIEFPVLQSYLEKKPALAVSLLKIMGAHMRKQHSKFRDLLLYGKKGALYSTLIRLANSYGKEMDGGILISVPLTNQELANYSATARESLNRMLSELRKSDIIEYRGHLIFIKDIDYLKEAIQCENCGREICNIE